MSNFEKTDLLTEEQKHQFVRLLVRSLDLRNDEEGKSTWNCSNELDHAIKALADMNFDSEKILEILHFFRDNGGYCDCEIMMNVVYGGDSDENIVWGK
jgi:hypothetical protein